MAGHSHWAGIKHRKGRADKLRSKIFSKLSKEITVAAKLGSKDSDMNPRLRSAIQAAKIANMPKENVERAINKSELNKDLNYFNIIYEGFGPEKIAVIVESLTDNKNKISNNDILELAINEGAEDCSSASSHHEIITIKEDYYKVKTEIEKKIKEFISSGIEWLPKNKISLDGEKTKTVLNFLETLEDDDDVQHVYANLELNEQSEKNEIT